MATKTITTRIQIRNDTVANWAKSDPVLLSGEMAVCVQTDGSVKLKVGNGSKKWSELDYIGFDEDQISSLIANAEDNCTIITANEDEDDDAALTRVITSPSKGDIAIVKRVFAENKFSHTGYCYDGTWKALSGNYNANNVYLDADIKMAGNYTQVGNLTKTENGTATFATKGKSIAEALTDIFSKRLQPGTPTAPAVTLTFGQANAYEVGTTVPPTYSASLSAGSYTYGPATGITATSWEITDTAGNTADTATGSFADVVVADNTNYKITAKANYGEGAVAKDNLGSDSNPVVKIAAGSATKTSGAITGYRNTFYGTVTEKATVTSTIIRGLTKSNKALANGNSFTVNIPVGAVRVIFAYPATLQDVSSVKDVNGLNAEIKSAFTKSAVTVAGAGADAGIEYKVYVTDFAEPVAKANSYTVKI